MLRLNHRQFAAFCDPVRSAFALEMVEHLHRIAAGLCAAIGPAAVRALVDDGMTRARDHGLSLRGPTRLFLELTLVLGHEFATDPLLAWAGDSLCDADAEPEMVRATRLYTRAGRYLEAVQGPGRRGLRAALVRAREACALPVPGPEQLLARLTEVWPEKCAHVGEHALRSLTVRAAAQAERLGLDTREGHALTCACMFGLGHGFASDPQHLWIAQSLQAARGLPADARAAQLLADSVLHLERAQGRHERSPLR